MDIMNKKKMAITRMILSIFMMLMAILQVYYIYKPKIGPVGEGINDRRVIWLFSLAMIASLSFLTESVYTLYRINRDKDDKK